MEQLSLKPDMLQCFKSDKNYYRTNKMSNRYKQSKQVADDQHRVAPYESGMNRRDFLQHLVRHSGEAATLLAGLMVTKPSVALSFFEEDPAQKFTRKFTVQEKKILEAVQMQLFPADGDGPSAAEINGFTYLDWALNDPANVEDGDREFIIKGIGWLQDFSKQSSKITAHKPFTQLSGKQQHKLLEQFSKTGKHENWMSLLVYYLLEALLLDPVYGGNPDGIGWKWLEHQPGFPRPGKGQTYHRYLT